jgi:hypothetical protein
MTTFILRRYELANKSYFYFFRTITTPDVPMTITKIASFIVFSFSTTPLIFFAFCLPVLTQ